MAAYVLPLLVAVFVSAVPKGPSFGPGPVPSPPTQDTAYDTDAFYVDITQAKELGALLATHKVIRLGPFDYSKDPALDPQRAPPLPNITVSSGMRVYGLPGTGIPGVVVTPGSTAVLITTVRTGLLYFPPAAPGPASVTKFCSFFHIEGAHVHFDGAVVSDLQMVGMTELGSPDRVSRPYLSPAYTVGGMHVGRGSSVTNCKFVRLMVHAPWPTLTVDLTDSATGQ